MEETPRQLYRSVGLNSSNTNHELIPSTNFTQQLLALQQQLNEIQYNYAMNMMNFNQITETPSPMLMDTNAISHGSLDRNDISYGHDLSLNANATSYGCDTVMDINYTSYNNAVSLGRSAGSNGSNVVMGTSAIAYRNPTAKNNTFQSNKTSTSELVLLSTSHSKPKRLDRIMLHKIGFAKLGVKWCISKKHIYFMYLPKEKRITHKSKGPDTVTCKSLTIENQIRVIHQELGYVPESIEPEAVLDLVRFKSNINTEQLQFMVNWLIFYNSVIMEPQFASYTKKQCKEYQAMSGGKMDEDGQKNQILM